MLLVLSVADCRADDFIVYSPQVQASQTELELRGYQYQDSRAMYSGSRAAEFSIAHAFIGWWKPELYLARYEQDAGSGGRLVGYEFENTLQLTPPGEFWADLGLLASYEHQTVAGQPDAVEFGPLLEQHRGRLTWRVNLIWEKELGAGANRQYQLRSSYSVTYAVSGTLRPGFEAYVRPDDSAYQAGPIVAGEWHVPGTTGDLEYRVGVVLGLNDAAPRGTWLAQLEYEFL
jgi:hypothetical protein